MGIQMELGSLAPGFGFHPTEPELILYYLKRKILHQKAAYEMPVIDIYKHDPWDLPAKCNIQTSEHMWHFLVSQARRYPNSDRIKRATMSGYWKSTGRDRSIKVHKNEIGKKKTLVFYEGRPPSGRRTAWIMHEYYIDDKGCENAPDKKDSFVLCRVMKRNDGAADGSSLQSGKVDAPNHPDQTCPAEQELEVTSQDFTESKFQPEERFPGHDEDETNYFAPEDFASLGTGNEKNHDESPENPLNIACSSSAQSLHAPAVAAPSFPHSKEHIDDGNSAHQQHQEHSFWGSELLPVVTTRSYLHHTPGMELPVNTAIGYSEEISVTNQNAVSVGSTFPDERICEHFSPLEKENVSSNCDTFDSGNQDMDFLWPEDICNIINGSMDDVSQNVLEGPSGSSSSSSQLLDASAGGASFSQQDKNSSERNIQEQHLGHLSSMDCSFSAEGNYPVSNSNELTMEDLLFLLDNHEEENLSTRETMQMQSPTAGFSEATTFVEQQPPTLEKTSLEGIEDILFDGMKGVYFDSMGDVPQPEYDIYQPSTPRFHAILAEDFSLANDMLGALATSGNTFSTEQEPHPTMSGFILPGDDWQDNADLDTGITIRQWRETIANAPQPTYGRMRLHEPRKMMCRKAQRAGDFIKAVQLERVDSDYASSEAECSETAEVRKSEHEVSSTSKAGAARKVKRLTRSSANDKGSGRRLLAVTRGGPFAGFNLLVVGAFVVGTIAVLLSFMLLDGHRLLGGLSFKI